MQILSAGHLINPPNSAPILAFGGIALLRIRLPVRPSPLQYLISPSHHGLSSLRLSHKARWLSDKEMNKATALYEKAAKLKGRDAMEILDIEAAKEELEDE